MLSRFSIQNRILIGFGCVILFTLCVSALSLKTGDELAKVFDGYRATAQQTLKVEAYGSAISDAKLALYSYSAQPTPDRAARAAEALEAVKSRHLDATRLLTADAAARDVLDALSDGLAALEQKFQSFQAKEQETRALIETFDALPPKFEAAVNGMLFTAQITGDQAAAEKGAAAILSITRGVSAFRSFLSSGDAEARQAAGPFLAEARSQLETVKAHLDRQNADSAGAAEAIDTVDALRALAPRIVTAVADLDARRGALLELGPALLADVATLRGQVVARQKTLGEAADGRIAGALSLTLWVGAAAVAAAIGLALWIGRAISRDVLAQADAMTRLAEGDLSVAIEGDDRGPEIGRMAGALRIFKANAEQVSRAAAEKAANERQAAEDRRAMMMELQTAFGAVVDAAVAGDFSARVTARFDDPELTALAESVNRLVESVQDGVSETGRVISRIAEGDLTERMEGAYAGAFAELQNNLNGAIETLSDMAMRLTEQCAAVSQGGAMIASGAEALSERAGEQASALEETAATMEEMAASVKENADNSGGATAVASDAAARAEATGEISEQAVAAMGAIEKSSSQIAAIISVIDSIAFQTNLLALNAAVEAARAGDAGKGFAVVASEVRTLAQRSSEAARDSRALIEEGGRHVSDGVALVQRSGASLAEIMDAIKQAEGAMGAIASACGQQATSVSEVSASISQLDNLTQQNASMAQESAAQAQRLAQAAEEMRRLLGFFRTGAASHRRAA